MIVSQMRQRLCDRRTPAPTAVAHGFGDGERVTVEQFLQPAKLGEQLFGASAQQPGFVFQRFWAFQIKCRGEPRRRRQTGHRRAGKGKQLQHIEGRDGRDPHAPSHRRRMTDDRRGGAAQGSRGGLGGEMPRLTVGRQDHGGAQPGHQDQTVAHWRR